MYILKILNFGSLNIDHVYAVNHFVAPGETMSSLGLDIFAGGKGLNQSLALKRAGADVYHAGLIGKDGEMLRNLLSENGVNIDCLGTADVPTGHAIIQVNEKGQNCIILYGGSNVAITKDFAKEVIDKFDSGDILLLQNEINEIDFIINYASERGMRIALNPSPLDDALLKYPLEKVEWFILNEIEGEQMTGKTNPDEIIDTMHSKFPNCKIVLTLGKNGVRYSGDGESYTHGIYDVPVVDTTAAGDTFTGYFLACICEGLGAEIALEKASIASSLSVTKQGAAPSIPVRSEVDNTDIKLDPRFL